MADMRWTPAQQDAISARGGTLLVSAAAGSGKTAVLTERAVRRMLDDENPIDADRLLVVTFTRAAAQEMKQRLIGKLVARIEAEPENAAARRQRVLLDRATIGTIHSLCFELLRQNFQKLGLPASFRIGDEQETSAMREEAVCAALEEGYQNTDDRDFFSLVELMSNRSGDGSLADTVLRVLDFARAHPF
ncbi:MAG: UvrD-helicase domain-containing protein, partial [Oscillospiraceae bacterium]